jgi:hypothetical protein
VHIRRLDVKDIPTDLEVYLLCIKFIHNDHSSYSLILSQSVRVCYILRGRCESVSQGSPLLKFAWNTQRLFACPGNNCYSRTP